MLLRRIAPLLFVLIWSTGFIAGRAAKPHADLLLFLLVRLGGAAALFALATLHARAEWPRGGKIWGHLLAGGAMQGVYLGFSYWAMSHGLAAGVMSLIGALQPLFTAIISTVFLRVRLSGKAWGGLAIGITGVALVLLPKLGMGGGLTPVTVLAALLSVAGMTLGTLLQKSLGGADLRAAGGVQNLGGGFVVALLIAAQSLVEGRPLYWDAAAPGLWLALAWSVIMPSLVAVSLLVWMVRQGEATRATSLILLVPPLAAVQAYLLFGETLTVVQLAGFALALGGVMLTRRELAVPARAEQSRIARA